LYGGTTTLSLTGLQASSDLADLTGWSNGDIISIIDSSGTTSLTIGTTITTVQDYVDALNDLSGLHASFDEDSDSIEIVSGLDNPLTIAKSGAGATATITLSVAPLSSTATLISSGGFQAGDTITITDGNGFEPASLELDDETTVSDLVTFMDNVKGLDATFSGGGISLIGEVSFSISSDNVDFNRMTLGSATSTVDLAAAASEFKTDTDINRTLQAINAALDELRSAARQMGTALSTVEIRTDFTENLINTLEVGAGELTIADMNEEGANMLALQTRQQLSSTALSLANQADQSVLSLFG
ncbi:MAG: flagellin, partial [Roseibium sp.]|uniref:flagellin n=1 Tax=Roseibium sp. TaxID=1936156 RepID=UPI0032994394